MKETKLTSILLLLLFTLLPTVLACTSNSDCTDNSNGYCDVLKQCKYCSEGKFYSWKLYTCASCDDDHPCNAQDNGYCNILGECHYCPSGQHYSLSHAGCVECESNSQCNSQGNGVCGILSSCFYCSGNTPVYSDTSNKCVECNSNSDCTAQTNGECETILHTCHYCSGSTPYYNFYIGKCTECSTNSDCTAQTGGSCSLFGKCTYSGTPCTEADWQSSLSPEVCPSSGQQTKIWTNINPSCNKGTGVAHSASEQVSCNPSIPSCVYSYSDWSDCSPNGVKTRTYTSTPANCQGNPIISQSCSYTPDDNNNEDNNNDNSEDNNQQTDSSNNSTVIILSSCSGCEIDGTCYPINNRMDGKYCTVQKTWINQKGVDSSCENNFECLSNVCVSEKCIDSSFIQRIINWFKAFFRF